MVKINFLKIFGSNMTWNRTFWFKNNNLWEWNRDKTSILLWSNSLIFSQSNQSAQYGLFGFMMTICHLLLQFLSLLGKWWFQIFIEKLWNEWECWTSAQTILITCQMNRFYSFVNYEYYFNSYHPEKVQIQN